MRARSLVVTLVAALVAAGPAVAQPDLGTVFSELTWRGIGPAVMGGRVADIAVDPTNSFVIYVGTATGGVWKSTNHGTSWTPLFDDQPTSSIGDVTIAPSNPNVVWVGSGEPQNRQSSPWGNGVYRSLDAGRSWQHMGLEETHHIGRIVIHPRDPDVVYVAAVGHLWGPNPERGVFKTTDGGSTWSKVLYVDDNTGAIDLVMDPDDPQTLFAAMYQRRRTAWGFNGGGPGSGLYRTVDGGATWERLGNGLPAGPIGRIGLSVYRGNGQLVYASVEALGDARGIYRSTDRGNSWQQVSDWNPRPMYFSQIRVDPNNPDKLFLGGVSLSISDDGGRTWDRNAADAVHSDHHAIWIDPANSDHVLMGSDGGVTASFDGGASWRMYDNLPIGQFYEIGLDMREPYYVCGGLQDNGSWCGPTNTMSDLGIRNGDWYNIWGGDGFYARIDANDPTIVYAESQNGNSGRLDLTTFEKLRIRPSPPPPEGGGETPEYRWNWNAPMVLSTHDPATLYVGANVVLKSTDRGYHWVPISPDLTKAIDRSTLPIMGMLPTDSMLSRHDGVSSFGNITTMSESPLDANVLYVGTDDGNVQMTRDGGATWVDLTSRFRDLPERTYVSRVVASAHDVGTAYATFDGHFGDDYKAYVYVTRNFGRSWQAITTGLPESSVNVVAEDPAANLLFVGNEIGVYVSLDGGGRWTRLKNNLPTVPVDDIKVHPREHDLVLGTHGRSIWVLDDITPLEDLTPQVLAADVHLFPVRAAMTYNQNSPQGWTPGAFEAPNPPEGARVRYYVRGGSGSSGDSTVRLTIRDAAGAAVRTLDGPATAGIHEVLWDLRYDPPYRPEGQGRGFFGRPRGPRVLPGTYAVDLTAGGRTLTRDITVAGDRRIEVARADLEARQQALMRLYRLGEPVYLAGRAVERLSNQVRDARRLLRERGAPDSLTAEADSLREALRALGREVAQVGGRAARLFAGLEGWTARPTPDQEREVDRVGEDATAAVRRVNTIITQRMPAFYHALDAHGIRPDPGTPIPVPGSNR